MGRQSANKIAREQKSPEDLMPFQVRGRALRNRMAAEWSHVLDMLESGRRRDKSGRTITEVWADMVLADPPGEFARVASLILPKEQELSANAPTVSIQQLYLSAVQAAQSAPNPKQIEAKALPDNGKSEEW